MELKELSEKVVNLFGVDSVSKLGNKLKETVLTNDTSKYAEFVNIIEDLSIDWMQKIYQYYVADRKDKKQDYTPKSLSKLVAKLTETNGEVVYDICAGSGALTIQKWCLSPQKTFICEELDENVFPYLAFNMAVRNMNGYIIMRNVLSLELIAVYQVIKGNSFSTVKQIQDIPDIKADEIISNPPYNIKWDAPEPLFADERFQGKVIPPASNANYAFVMTALSRLSEKGKCAFILPCGVLNSEPEKRKS